MREASEKGLEKLVDCSTLPDAGTEKAIAHNAQATKILQCAAQTSDGATLPMDRSNYGTVSVMATLTDIRMRTGAGANVNWLTATCRLWYTKD